MAAFALLVLFGGAACHREGQALGTLAFAGPGSASTVLEVDSGRELFLRIEGDAIGGSGTIGDHQGRYRLRLQVTPDQPNQPEATTELSCDPLHLGLSGSALHDDADVSFSGDIQDCVVRPAPAGRVRLQAELEQPGPTDIAITGAIVTVMGAPVRPADTATGWWEGGVATLRAKLVAFAALAAFLAAAVLVAHRRSRRREAGHAAAWRDGEAATARVVALRDTGGMVNDHPKVDLTLEVTRRDGTQMTVTERLYIAKLAVPRVQPDCEIAVRLSPDDDNRVVIDPELEYRP